MEEINIILPEGMTMGEDKSVLPNPDEVLYWNNYKNRTFYIDYEIEDDYELLELSKLIVQFKDRKSVV